MLNILTDNKLIENGWLPSVTLTDVDSALTLTETLKDLYGVNSQVNE